MKGNLFIILLLCVILLAGVIGGQAPASSALSKPLPASIQPPVIQNEENQQKWRADLNTLVKGLRKRHPNPFHGISEAEFNAAVASLDARIATLTDNQINGELVGLVASISRNGRDGHTQFIPSPIHLLPLQLYVFGDGVFIIDALPAFKQLVGRRVTGIGGHSIEEILTVLTPYVSKDNASTVQWQLPTYLLVSEFFESLGFIADRQRVPLQLQDQSGAQETVTLTPLTIPQYVAGGIDFPANKLPQTHDELYLSDSQNAFWFTYLADSGTLYIRYNQVLKKNDAGQKLAKFVKQFKNEFNSKSAQRLVIDLRQNNGGDSNTYEPLLAALRDTPAINQRGKLFAIINQGVFSAASNFVTDLERQTNVLFVGSPIGGSPNHYGDAVPVMLPNFGGTLLVSTVYHQKSTANDPRLTVEPHMAVELSSSDYFAGRDSALIAILNYTAQQRRTTESDGQSQLAGSALK